MQVVALRPLKVALQLIKARRIRPTEDEGCRRLDIRMHDTCLQSPCRETIIWQALNLRVSKTMVPAPEEKKFDQQSPNGTDNQQNNRQ